MAISFVATETHAGSATTRTPSEPTGTAENDIVIAFGTKAETDGTWTDPADFIPIDEVQYLATGRSYLGYKIRGATSGSGYSFSHSGLSQQMRVTLVTLRGIDTSTPFDVAYVNADHYVEDLNELIAAKPITTVTDGAWVLLFYHEQSDTTFTAGAPSGYTLRADDQGGAGTVIVIASKEVSSAGLETPGVWTHADLATSASCCAFTLALRPASGGSSTTVVPNAAGMSV